MRRGRSPPPLSPLFPTLLALPWRPRKAPRPTRLWLADLRGAAWGGPSAPQHPASASPTPHPGSRNQLGYLGLNPVSTIQYCVVLGRLVNVCASVISSKVGLVIVLTSEHGPGD